MVTCGGAGLWNCRVAGTWPLGVDDDGNRMVATKYLFLIRTILQVEYSSWMLYAALSLRMEDLKTTTCCWAAKWGEGHRATTAQTVSVSWRPLVGCSLSGKELHLSLPFDIRPQQFTSKSSEPGVEAILPCERGKLESFRC